MKEGVCDSIEITNKKSRTSGIFCSRKLHSLQLLQLNSQVLLSRGELHYVNAFGNA
jgi:hypothetical protein